MRRVIGPCVLMLALVFSSEASAEEVPTSLPFQAYVTNLFGDPLEGSVSIEFAFYDGSTTGDTKLWSDSINTDAQDGFVVTSIGNTANPLEYDVFDTIGTVYFGMSINGEAMDPLVPVHAVPFAMWAANALSETEIRDLLKSNLVPTDCDDGQTVTWNETNALWACEDLGTGPTGADGATGLQGPIGATGLQGATGADGATGLQGPIGAIGLQGATGADGATGLQGPIGETGLQGATGADGADGADGATGLQGATGAAGAMGLQGVAGAMGATGLQGAAGAMGATGLQGTTGAAGPTGAMGLQGTTGAAGAMGATGLQGTTGAAGAMGATGLQGTTGAAGATGPQGPAGGGAAVIDASGNTLGSLVALGSYGVEFITSTGHHMYLQWDGTSPAGQIWYTGASCTGTAILNAGSASAPPTFGKGVVYSRAFSTLMVPKVSTINATTGSAPNVGTVAVLSIDNPNCGGAASGNGYELEAVTAAAIGLPAYPVTTPLVIQ